MPKKPAAAPSGATTSQRTAKVITVSKRQQRALRALQRRPHFREELDRICGVSNSPDEIYRLRKRRFGIETEMVPTKNEFGEQTHAGRYHLVSVPEGFRFG